MKMNLIVALVSQAAAQTGPVLNETFSILYAEAFDSLVALCRVKSSGALFQLEKLWCAQLRHLQAMGVAEITSYFLFHKYADIYCSSS